MTDMGPRTFYGRNFLGFVTSFSVICYYNLDLVLNQVAWNTFGVVPLRKILPPQGEGVCGGPGKSICFEIKN